jgi:hypothetical protein
MFSSFFAKRNNMPRLLKPEKPLYVEGASNYNVIGKDVERVIELMLKVYGKHRELKEAMDVLQNRNELFNPNVIDTLEKQHHNFLKLMDGSNDEIKQMLENARSRNGSIKLGGVKRRRRRTRRNK